MSPWQRVFSLLDILSCAGLSSLLTDVHDNDAGLDCCMRLYRFPTPVALVSELQVLSLCTIFTDKGGISPTRYVFALCHGSYRVWFLVAETRGFEIGFWRLEMGFEMPWTALGSIARILQYR